MIVGSLLKTGTVWKLAETVNGLMAIPNLIVLAYLAPELKRLTVAIYGTKSWGKDVSLNSKGKLDKRV